MYPRAITYRVNGPGTDETADGYVATPVRYSTISVEDLADHISADSRVERSKVAVITDSLIKQIREMVLNGHKIVVPHLGSFKPKIKSELAVNPESVDAASFSAKVRFSPSVELKRDLQASRIERTELPTAPAAPPIADQMAATLSLFKKDAVKWALENWQGAVAKQDLNYTRINIGTDSNIVNVNVCSLNFQVGEEERYVIGWCIAKNDATNSYDGFYEGNFVNNSLSKMTIGPWAENYYAIKRYKFSEPFSYE